ncbi:hypothetical protein ACFQ5M_04390 [Agrilactobacillus yilanensis]|uniref:M50 family peptidase n=1 Tax=Agrilactobacillus yilanensis TaxID=2485997 RepID=A0ABW4J6P1_9LACO|nr:hypothetical protein [Agrilactobacillus yilanensis]
MIIFKTYVLPWLLLFVIIYSYTFVLKWLLDHTKQRISQTFGVKAQLYFGFLGIWIHEISHAFFALLFHHRIVDMKLMEYRPTGQDVTLGHVDHSFNKRSIYQMMGNFFIGIGPLIGCSAFLVFAFRLLVPASYDGFATILENFVSRPEPLLLMHQLWQAILQIHWQGTTFFFLLLLILTTIGFGLSMADIKNSVTGLPYMLILCIIISLLTFALKLNLTLFLTKLDLVSMLILSVILVISILYSLLISGLCRIF